MLFSYSHGVIKACFSHKAAFLEAEALPPLVSQVPGTAPDILKTKHKYRPRHQPPRKQATATTAAAAREETVERSRRLGQVGTAGEGEVHQHSPAPLKPGRTDSCTNARQATPAEGQGRRQDSLRVTQRSHPQGRSPRPRGWGCARLALPPAQAQLPARAPSPGASLLHIR